LLTDPGFLNKGEFDELARTLQEEKIVFRELCIPFYSVGYLKELFLRVIVFYCVFSIYLGNTETIDFITKGKPMGFYRPVGLRIQSDL
jgi:hypothetical protein